MRTPSVESLYVAAHQMFTELAHELAADDWATPVPCCPGWTVRDVLSHVSGIPDDAMAGRLDGAATEPWTAAQVERNRSFSVDELLARWDAQAPTFAALIDAGGEARPPFDCHTHEHDIRHALGRPGNRSSVIVRQTPQNLIDSMVGPFSLTVEFDDGAIVSAGSAAAGENNSVTFRGVTEFELFRSRLGRRSRSQVERYDWSGPTEQIDAVIADWFGFGPSEIDIDEA